MNCNYCLFSVFGFGKHSNFHLAILIDQICCFLQIINKTLDYNRSKILKEIDIFHHCQGHKNILQLNEFYEEDEHFYLVFNKLKGGKCFTMSHHLTQVQNASVMKA